MKIDDKLAEVFDIEPVREGEVITKSGEVVVPHSDNKSERVDYDYDKTRNNLHGLLGQG